MVRVWNSPGWGYILRAEGERSDITERSDIIGVIVVDVVVVVADVIVVEY